MNMDIIVGVEVPDAWPEEEGGCRAKQKYLISGRGDEPREALIVGACLCLLCERIHSKHHRIELVQRGHTHDM